MDLNTATELARLERMKLNDLRDKYAELFGDSTTVNNKPWLIKRIAWRLQALAEGGLSERARRRAAELANDADLRLSPPKKVTEASANQVTKAEILKFQEDERVPPPGTILTRAYKGDTLQVLVLADGFQYQDKVYPSLSAVAKAITGSHCNGFLFFKLGAKGGGT